MDLTTMRYLEPVPVPVSEKPAGSEDLAWTEVTKGLLAVLVRHDVTIGSHFGYPFELHRPDPLSSRGDHGQLTAQDVPERVCHVTIVWGAGAHGGEELLNCRLRTRLWKLVANAARESRFN